MFGYDRRTKFTREDFPDGTSVRYGYTPTGRRATDTDASGTTTYEYDAMDRLVARTTPDGQTLRYTYDAAGNELSLTDSSGTTRHATPSAAP